MPFPFFELSVFEFPLPEEFVDVALGLEPSAGVLAETEAELAGEGFALDPDPDDEPVEPAAGLPSAVTVN